MEVEDNHNFAIEGGLIVHNCMDATRYFVKTERIAMEKRRIGEGNDNISRPVESWRDR